MPIKIFLGYQPIEAPGGGANNFLRALYRELDRSGKFELVSSLDSMPDIVLMNQLNAGEGREKYRLREVLELKSRPGPSGRAPRIVVRAVNLRRHSYGRGFRTWWKALREDRDTLRLVNSADFVIFQSRYQEQFFRRFGFSLPSCRVIYNGADSAFLGLPRRSLAGNERILLVSATSSPRRTKRHDVIARLAECEGVEVRHFGRWPSSLPSGKVSLMGVCTHEEMRATYAKAHGFVHPAIKDPCPNAIIEALASGLPILYGDGVGSSVELVKGHGIKLASANPEASVAMFRTRYRELTDLLEPSRTAYCINRAADEYSNVLECLGEPN